MYLKIRTRENTGVDYEDKAMRTVKSWIMVSWNKVLVGYRLATPKGLHQYSSKCDPRPDASETSGVLIKNASFRVVPNQISRVGMYIFIKLCFWYRLKFAKYWPIILSLLPCEDVPTPLRKRKHISHTDPHTHTQPPFLIYIKGISHMGLHKWSNRLCSQ